MPMTDRTWPAHITERSGMVTVSGSWYVHDHPHGHPDLPNEVGHRHEHCWDDPEHHHHPLEEP